MAHKRHDSDETEGRALYRALANARAKLDTNMADRKPKLVSDDDPGRPVPRHGSGPDNVPLMKDDRGD